MASGVRNGRSITLIIAAATLLPIATAVTIAYRPALAIAGIYVVLLVIARSLESRIALWLVIRLLAFSGYISLSYAELALALIVVVALIDRIGAKERLRFPPFVAIWTIFLLLTLLNLIVFRFPNESLTYSSEVIVENFGLLVMMSNSRSRFHRGYGPAVAAACVILAIGLFAGLEIVVGHPLLVQLSTARLAYIPTTDLETFQGSVRPGSLLFNPDWLAVAMALGCVLWTGLAISTRGVVRFLSIGCAVVLLGVGVATLSRALFIGIPAGLLGLMLFDPKGLRRSVLVIGALLATAGVFIGSEVAQTALARLVTIGPVDSLRFGAAETALRVMADRPFFGLGPGWQRYLELAEPYRVPLQGRPLAHPHNSFLEIGAMLGVPALIVFVVLVVVAARRGWRFRRRLPQLRTPFAGIVVLVIMSLAVNGITLPFLGTFFWVLWWAVAASQPGTAPDLKQAAVSQRLAADLDFELRSSRPT